MAVIDNNFRKGYIVRINYTVNSHNKDRNTSNVTVRAQLVSTGSSYNIISTATKYGTLRINGVAYNFSFKGANLPGGSTKTVYSITVDIPHNSDGTKYCSMSLSLGIKVTLSGKYWDTVSCSGNVELPAIARDNPIPDGAFTTSDKGIYYIVKTTINSQDSKALKSNITVQVIAYTTRPGRVVTGYGTCELTIERNRYKNSNFNNPITNTGTVILTATADVYHGNANAKTVPMTVTVDHDRFVSVVYAYSVTLPEFHRPGDSTGGFPKYYYTPWIYSTNGVYRFTTNIILNSQDYENNTSNVTFEMVVQRIYAGYTGLCGTCYCNIDGTTYWQSTGGTQINNVKKVLFRKTVNVKHNSDGTKRLYFTPWISHGSFYTIQKQMYIDLPAIARKTSIQSIVGSTIGYNMTVNLRKGASHFTTSVYLQVNGSQWFKVADRQSGSSITFKIPNELALHIPNKDKDCGRVIVRTHCGNRDLGDTCWCREFIIPGWMGPKITQLHMYTNTTFNTNGGNKGMWIQGKSKARFVVDQDYSDLHGATIVSCNIQFNGASYSNGQWTGIIRQYGCIPVTAVVRDSRGRTATIHKSIYVHPYIKPTINISAYRCSANGTRDDMYGTKVKVILKAEVSSMGGCNTMQVAVKYKSKGGNYINCSNLPTIQSGKETSFILDGPFAEDTSYELQVVVSDYFFAESKKIKINQCFVLLDFGPGGKSIGVGVTADKDYYMNLGVDLKFCNGEGVIDHEDETQSGYIFMNSTRMGIYDNKHGNVYTWEPSSNTVTGKAITTTSDERMKYNIDDFSNWDDYYSFYMSLQPKTFKLNNDVKERTSIGLIAQEVADSIVDNNLMNEKLNLMTVLENEDMEDGREYGLVYQELIALNIKMIQKHEKEIQELKDKLNQK